MHCKKLRSEYMKRFKDPQWEAYGKCYEEMLKYRVTRRLLEQAHNPWLWEGWEGASDSSSGHSTAQRQQDTAPANHQPINCAAAPQKPRARVPAPQKQSSSAEPLTLQKTHDSKDVALKQLEINSPSAEAGQQDTRQSNEKEISIQESQNVIEEKSSRPTRQQQNRAASSKCGGHKSPQRIDVTKENRHPFALYACGEKKKDTGSQKTHNVFAPTNENEIHESALRAKNRRQKEKWKQRQRARSADAETILRRIPTPVENPWMTEYMRCFSARDR
ncbi:centriole, cilia and spindle-associated protein [Pelodytes ibericus]